MDKVRQGRLGRRSLTVLACLLTATIAPASAQAFELFGIRFFGSADEEPPSPDAHPYILDFRVETPDTDLADRVRSASQLYVERENVPDSTPALLARGRGDYARILAGLYAQGRYGGVITITAAGRPIEEYAPDAALPVPVPVMVTVDPGPPFAFGRIGVEGRPPAIADDRDVPEPVTELGLVPGAPARSTVVLQSEANLVGRWRELGHPKARIAQRQAVAQHSTSTLDVAMQVDPGRPAVFGPVTVTGTERMNPAFVARQSAIPTGEPFDPDDIDRARDQLRRLEVFQAIQIVEAEEITPEGTLPIMIQVAERPRRVIGGGAAYSTLDGARLEAYWQHRNLFGQAERLRIEGRVGQIGNKSVEDYDYYAGVTFLKPGVITPFTDLTATAYAEQESPDSYLARIAGARLGLSHRFSDELTGTIAANVERSRIEDPLGTNDYLLASIPMTLAYDSRDDELNPTEGIRAALRVEPFHEFEFGNTAVITDLRGSTYFALDPDDRFILALRAGIGSISGAPRDQIPANRLFYLGGGGSIRGYAYRNVGPLLPNGEVLGGRSYVDGSVELRAQVTDTIGVVPFVDFGNAFASELPDFSQELKIGAGIGLRYFTSFGPLRLDVAFPLDPGPGDPDFAIYLGLGQSF